MNRGQFNRLLARAQTTLAALSPASIRIGGQDYDAGTSGWMARERLAEGGADAERRIGFILPLASFTAAGKPRPTGLDPMECLSPEEFAGPYIVDAVDIDAGGVNVIIRCVEPPQ